MSFWEWFRAGCFSSLFFWWVVFIFLTVLSVPFVRRFRTWQAKRRFIASRGMELQNPQNAEARFQLANIHAEGRSWRRAEEYAREAVRVAEENPLYERQVPYHFLRLWGDVLLRRGRSGEAADAYQRALAAPSKLGHAEAWFGLGRAHHVRGHLAKSLECYRKALDENTSNLEGYFRVAQAGAKAGHADAVKWARAEFRRVAASLPRFAGRKRFRWRLAFALFPIARFIA